LEHLLDLALLGLFTVDGYHREHHRTDAIQYCVVVCQFTVVMIADDDEPDVQAVPILGGCSRIFLVTEIKVVTMPCVSIRVVRDVVVVVLPPLQYRKPPEGFA
jgi:hypothetical protein